MTTGQAGRNEDGNTMWALTGYDKERFAEHAAPEAIERAVLTARAERCKIQAHIDWLELLLARRVTQVARGTWPPPGSES